MPADQKMGLCVQLGPKTRVRVREVTAMAILTQAHWTQKNSETSRPGMG